ncbi:unnamed protein product [Miscanthus lutarioriparius]|uniref:Uncharacterized protein n=1 Tax=Miscanthus lutarioriparius TaxID=422564 RepID=A0A811PHM4_9POAL|nr:unnamed protein product [Miscanthus lutarioriparius]
MPRGEPLHFAGCKTDFISTASGNWLVYRRFCDLLLVDPFSGATTTLPAPSSVHLADESEGDDSMDGHDSVDEVEDSEYGHDSADEGDDSEDGSAPSRVHLPDGNKGDDSRAGHDSADEAEDSEDGHDSADEADDSEDGSTPSSVHLPNENKGDDSRAGHDSTVEGEDSEDSHDSADEGDDSEDGSTPSKVHLLDKDEGDDSRDGHDSADEGEDSEGGHDSAGVGDDSEDGSVYTDRSEMLSMDVKHFEVIKLMVCSPNLIAALLKEGFSISMFMATDRYTLLLDSEPDVSISEADFGRSQWRRLTTLADDEALFLGPCSRAVCMPQGDSPGNRVWFLDDYKDFHLWNEWPSSLSSDTSSVANPKPFSPLPMISWRGFLANSGAAWLFPSN